MAAMLVEIQKLKSNPPKQAAPPQQPPVGAAAGVNGTAEGAKPAEETEFTNLKTRIETLEKTLKGLKAVGCHESVAAIEGELKVARTAIAARRDPTVAHGIAGRRKAALVKKLEKHIKDKDAIDAKIIDLTQSRGDLEGAIVAVNLELAEADETLRKAASHMLSASFGDDPQAAAKAAAMARFGNEAQAMWSDTELSDPDRMRRFVEWTYETAWSQCRAVGTMVHANDPGRPPPQQGAWPAGMDGHPTDNEDEMLHEEQFEGVFDINEARRYGAAFGVDAATVARISGERAAASSGAAPYRPTGAPPNHTRYDPYGDQPPAGAPRGDAAVAPEPLDFEDGTTGGAGEAAPTTPLMGAAAAPSPLDLGRG